MSRKFQCKAVPSSWLEKNGRRLDCGPYLSGGIEARELMRRFNTETLEALTEGIYHAGREGRQYVVDSRFGVPFMGSTDILQSDLSFLPLLSKKQVEHNPNFTIQEGWTLITRSGTTGRMAYARKDIAGLACSEHVMRVVPAVQKVKSGYIFAYLSSRFGVPLIVSGTYGSIIQSLEPHHISGLPVPRLGRIELDAHHLVEKSADLLTGSQVKLNEATKLYFDSVGLTDVTPTEWNSWGADVGFAATAGVQSLRALNFNPRFNKICERIKQGPWKPLGTLCMPGTLKRGNRFNRIDADPEFAYKLIGQKELFWLRPEGRWISKNSVPNDALIKDGSILVAARGTLGESELYCRAEYVFGKSEVNAYSEDILRIIGDESVIKRGALFAFMRSETAFRMLRSISVGSKLQDHHYTMLPALPIPYPLEGIRSRCNDLVVQAFKAREKAVELEDEARTLVERAIEEGAR